MFVYSHFEELAAGEARLKYLKKCIEKSDSKKNYSDSLKLRYMYIEESMFNGDNFKALIMFPEYMAMFNEHPDAHSEHSFMIAFKWILEDMLDFYQVSSENIEDYFEKFKEYCIKFGYSLRTYYMKKIKYYSIADVNKARELIELFRNSERDSLSDCRACEMSEDIKTELEFGSEEKAIKMLSHMIQKNISCTEVPETTYGACVEHFTKIGRLDEAEHYAEIVMPMIKDNINFLMEISNIMLLKSFTNLNDAYNIFCKYLDSFISCKNPKMRFYFANSASKFFKAINQIEEYNETGIQMKLPRTFELYDEENIYDVSSFISYFEEIAINIALKLDSRNKNSYYMDIITYEYPSEPMKELSLPLHGTVPRECFAIGIPFPDEESLPDIDKIGEIFESIDDFEIFNKIKDDENHSILILGVDKLLDSPFSININFSNEFDIDDFIPCYGIKGDIADSINQKYNNLVVISMILNKIEENYDITQMLKFANALNIHNSPILVDLINLRMLDIDWVKLNIKHNCPILDKYIYSIHKCCSALSEDISDFYTSGMLPLGIRDFIIINVEEQNSYFTYKILSQIEEKIGGCSELHDEGIPVTFGVLYDNKSEVHFSWIPFSKAYPEQFDEEYQFAVPVLYMSADDAEKGNYYLVNEIPEEIHKKIIFRQSVRKSRMESALAIEYFEYAAEALENYPGSKMELLCSVDVKYNDDEYEEVFAQLKSYDDTTITAEITDGLENIPDYQNGKIITVGRENIVTWVFIKNNEEHYLPDDTYLLLNGK